MRNWTRNIAVFKNNRRRHGRIGIELAKTTIGPIVDASARGMCVRTARFYPLRIGSKVVLEVTMPDRCAILNGRVVRIRGSGLLHKDVGVELEECDHTKIVLAEMLKICSVRGAHGSEARRHSA